MKFTEIISDGTPRGIRVGLFHIILILIAYTSPFWLAWQWVAIGIAFLYIEQLILGNCVLLKGQYGDPEGMLYENLLIYFHIPFNRKRLQLWTR